MLIIKYQILLVRELRILPGWRRDTAFLVLTQKLSTVIVAAQKEMKSTRY